MYFISEECYEVVSDFANKTKLDLMTDSIGNLYFNVNQFKIDNINFIFGQQNMSFLMGMLFGYLYKLNLSDISDIDININDINEFKLRNICLDSPVREMSDILGNAYKNLLKSFEKVKYIHSDEIFSKKYELDFLNLLSEFLIFCSYWNFEKVNKVAVFKEIQRLNYVYLSTKNLKCALRHGVRAISIIRGEN